MPDQINTHRKSTRLWIIGCAIVVVAAIALGVPQWAKWPKLIANEFASHVSADEFDEARRMLANPYAIQKNNDGSLTVTTTDGATIVLAKNELPFKQPDSFTFSRPTRNSIIDVAIGRYQFDMMTAGVDVQRERKEPVSIQMDSVRGKITIVGIVQH